MWIWQWSGNDKELTGISNAEAIHHKCRWFKKLGDLSGRRDVSFKWGERGGNMSDYTWGRHLQGWISQTHFYGAGVKREGRLPVSAVTAINVLTDKPASRGWFLTGAGRYAKSRKTRFCSFREEVAKPRAMWPDRYCCCSQGGGGLYSGMVCIFSY